MLEHNAQRASVPRPCLKWIAAAVMCGMAQGASAEGWRLSVGADVRATYSDNIRMRPTNERSDIVVEAAPRISLSGRAPRLTFTGSYAPRQITYLNDSQPGRLSHSLNANGRLEVVDDFFFLDGAAAMSEHNTSVFGVQDPNNLVSGTSADRTSTRTFSLSPSFRGTLRLWDIAAWQSSYKVTQSDTSSSAAGSVRSEIYTGALIGTPAKWSWRADITQQTTTPDVGRKSERDSLIGSLIFRPDTTLQLTGRYGIDKYTGAQNRFGTGGQTGSTHGVGVRWNPTPRTDLTFNRDWRVFGTTSNVTAQHRMGRSAFNVNYSRTLSTRAERLLGQVGVLDMAELLAQTNEFQVYTDPVERLQKAEQALALNGIPRYVSLYSPILSDREYFSTNLRFGGVHTGSRDTFSWSIFRSNSDSSLGTLGVPTLGDFASSGAIEQKGWTLSLAHRLSPDTSLNVAWTATETTGTRTAGLKTERDTLNATLSTRLGAKTTGSIGLRVTRASTVNGDVDENAVIASIGTRFF